MLKHVSSKLTLTAIIVSLTLYGCGGSDDEATVSADVAAAGEILQYVPADSPYVLAALAPMPDDVMDKLEPTIDQALASYEILLQELVVMASNEAEEKGENTEGAEKATAVIGELSSLMSVEGLRNAGFSRESRAVVYGNGLLPVIRIELTDGALFEAALSRVEESAGEKMEVATIAGNAVRYVVADEVKILVSVLDTQVVMSMAPPSFDDEQLSVLLGFTKPTSTIVDSGKLQGIADEYGYADYFLGYFDIETVANTVTGDARGLDADIFELHGGADELSAVCRDEIREMAGIMPRMVMGYTGVSTERFDTQMVMELRSDIAAGMTGMAAEVPGLSGDMGGLMSLGMSLDIKAVRAFIETQLDAIEEDPYMCPDFADIQVGAEQTRAALQQPVMPMIYDFRGFIAVIEDIEGLDFETQAPPTSVDGQFLLAMKNAPALVSLGAMFNPQLAELNLEANGEPVLLDLPQAQMMGGATYVALAEDALAISIGEGAESQLGAMLAAKSESNGTIFNFSMDAGRYYSFLGEAMARSEPDDENPMTPEFRQAMNDVMMVGAELYDRMTIDMRFTDKGVVIDSAITLSE